MRARKDRKKCARKQARIIPKRKVIESANPVRKTRVFQSGNSRAVRLPKEIHLGLGTVNIYQIGDKIVICKTQLTIGDIWKTAPKLPADFILERPKDDLPQERDFQWD